MVIKTIVNEVVDGAITSVTLNVDNDGRIVQSLSFDVVDSGSSIIIRESRINDTTVMAEASRVLIEHLKMMDVEVVKISIAGENGTYITKPISDLYSAIQIS